MKPLTLELLNVGRFPRLSMTFQDGVVALTGANGAGKSTVLNSIDAALFADGSRDLAPMLGMFGDRMEITLVFEHADETYRTRQGYRQTASGRGTATVDFEQLFIADTWLPLTRENADATRALIADTIGLTRQTFHASAFLKQGNSGAFPEASPADRKAILGQILDPHRLWPGLADRARADAKTTTDAILVAQNRIAEREQAAAGLAGLAEQHAAAAAAARIAKDAATLADEALETAVAQQAASAAAAERVKAAAAARDRAAADAGHARAEATVAIDAADRLPAAERQLAELAHRAGQVAQLEQQADRERRLIAAISVAAAERAAQTRQADTLEREADRLRSEHQRLTLHAATLHRQRLDLERTDDHAATCDACGQTLGAEARQERLRTLANEYVDAAGVADALADQLADVSTNAAAARAAIPAATDGIITPSLAGTEAQLQAARAAAAALPELRHTVETLAQHAARADERAATLRVAAAALAAAETALAEAAAGVADEARLAADVNDARMAVAARRRALDEAYAAAARLEHEVAQTRQLADSLDPLRADLAALHGRHDLLKSAEKAYGRDGIPALIAENVAVPYIEQETNRILERWPTADGSVLRVEIHTQKALKTADHLKETLLILVAHDGRQGDYLTFSGGERARLSIALRVALAKLLANRRGAESRLLVIDEPDALDAAGMEHLAVILADLSGTFDRILLVSHNPLLASAFEQTIEVEKAAGVSSIADAPVEFATAISEGR